MLKKIIFLTLLITLTGFLSLFYIKNPLRHHSLEDSLQLGEVIFSTSTTSKEAQTHFTSGMRYLHNFMYPLALREFTIAKKIDPFFALSYWGIAMSYRWPLWGYIDKTNGQQIIYEYERIKNMSIATPLEKDLLNAAKLIYEEGSIIENDRKYMKAMTHLYQHYPNNVEIASFYALSLLGYQADTFFDNKNLHYLNDARLVLKPFIKLHPKHPGIIHYYMHATDVPVHNIAQEGLIVTNNVFDHIKDSSHVLHMPSHLYTELGMWNEAIKFNERSIVASQHMCRFLKRKDIILDMPLSMCSPFSKIETIKRMPKKWDACDINNVYHSAEWLHYEYLQLGQYDKAANVIRNMKKIADPNNESMYLPWFYRLHARQIIYSERWTPLKRLPFPIAKTKDDILGAYSECGLLLADGLRAIYNRQFKFIPLIEQRFRQIIELLKNHEEGGIRTTCSLMQIEFLAAKAFYIDKNKNAAFHLLKNKLYIQKQNKLFQLSFSLPFIPLQEIYAEFLMKNSTQKNLLEAINLYKNELDYYPNRKRAQDGLAHAERLVINTAVPVTSHSQ